MPRNIFYQTTVCRTALETGGYRFSLRNPVYLRQEYCLIRYLLILVLCISTFTYAQQGNNAFYPDEVSIESFNNVSAQGDLGFSVPLINVPGRGGLGFQISLSYTPGIKVEQEATWAGLGWDIPIGSISRVPVGGAGYFCDFTDIPYIFPDIYTVNFPGGSGKMFAIPDENNNPKFVFEEHKPWEVTYEISSGQITNDPISEPSLYTDQADFNKFTITVENGVRYIFSELLLGSVTTHNYNIFQQEEGFPTAAYSNFVSTWQLTAIESPDYEDSNSNSEYDEDDKGAWVQIEYSYDPSINDDIYTYWDYLNGNTILFQHNYPHKIETPTHFAEFATFSRTLDHDRWLKDDQKLLPGSKRGLQNVKLYSKNITGSQNPAFVYGWEFEHGGYSGSNNFTLVPYQNQNKLTLNAFYKFTDRTTFPPYKLSYWQDSLSPVPNASLIFTHGNSGRYRPEKIDNFGYFRNATIPQSTIPSTSEAWSIKSLTNPAGLTVEFEWETDVFDLTDDDYTVNYVFFSQDQLALPLHESFGLNANSWPTSTYSRDQGGVRIKNLTFKQGASIIRTHRYEYGIGSADGRLTGVPDKIFGERFDFGTRASTPSPYYHSIHYSNSNEVGQTAVFYPKITEIIEDGSSQILGSIERFYSTDDEDPQKYQPNRAMGYGILGDPNGYVINETSGIIKENRSWNWGRLLKERSLNSTGQVVQETEYTYKDKLIHDNFVMSSSTGDTVISLQSYWSNIEKVEEKTYDELGNYLTQITESKFSFLNLQPTQTTRLTSENTTLKDSTVFVDVPIAKNGSLTNGTFNDIPVMNTSNEASLEPTSSLAIPGWQVTSAFSDTQSELSAIWNDFQEKEILFETGNWATPQGENTITLTSDWAPILPERNYRFTITGFTDVSAFLTGQNDPNDIKSGTFALARITTTLKFFDEYENPLSGTITTTHAQVEVDDQDLILGYSPVYYSHNLDHNSTFVSPANAAFFELKILLYGKGEENLMYSGSWDSDVNIKLQDVNIYPDGINATSGSVDYILAERNQLNLIESASFLEDDGVNNVLHSYSKHTYDNFGSGSWDAIRSKKQEVWEDVDFDHQIDAGELITAFTAIHYDEFGNLTESTDSKGRSSASHYEFDGTMPAGSISNATYDETLIENCESYRNISGYGDLSLSMNTYNNGNATISYSRSIDGIAGASQRIEIDNLTSGGAGININMGDLDGSKDYVIEFDYWVTEGQIEILSDADGYNYRSEATYLVTSDWQHARLIWDLGSSSGDGDNSQLWIRAPWSGSGASDVTYFLDNIRIYPANALASSTTYDPYTYLEVGVTAGAGYTTRILSDASGKWQKGLNQQGEPILSTFYSFSRDNSSSGNFDWTKPNKTIIISAQDSSFIEDFNEENIWNNWTIAVPDNDINWSVSNGLLKSTNSGSGNGNSYLAYDNFDAESKEIAIEYDVYFSGAAEWGGLWYRGVYCDISPQRFGWRDNSENFETSTIANDQWHRVVMLIKQGFPHLKSTLFIDGKLIFANEPIEITSFGRTDLGLVSQYEHDYVAYDNYTVLANPVTALNYFDAASRNTQITQVFGDQDIITHSDYDALSRPTKSWKPYEFAADHAYDDAYSTNANSFYDSDPGPDAGGYPYALTAYEDNLIGRISSQRLPGSDMVGNESNITYRVNTSGDGVSGYSANTLWRTITTDPDAVVIENFANLSGHNILRRGILNSTNIDTRFEYDAIGNLEKSIDPTNLQMEYLPNSLNQVIQTTMSDMDGDQDGNPTDEDIDHANPLQSTSDTDIKYDLSGNIRFQQNPALKSSGEIYYYQYDQFNRVILEGCADPGALTWSQLDAKQLSPYSFETNPEISYYYDTPDTEHPTAQNLTGRLSWIEYQFSSATDIATVHYSYNEIGQVEWQIHTYANLSAKKMSYEYNPAGALLKQSFNDLGATEEFHLWYEYDDIGRLKAVYHNNENVKPGFSSVEYEYWPTGQTKMAKLGQTAASSYAQEVSYEYNAQDWLKSINEGSLSGTERFAYSLNYYDGSIADNHNGNIHSETAIYDDQIDILDIEPVTYTYDDLNRLTKASRDLGKSQLYDSEYTYSANGNILSKTEGGTTFFYGYGSSNRLNSFGSTTFLYDYNGNQKRKTISPGSFTDFNFNHKNYLITADPNSTGSFKYGYDEAGNRILFENIIDPETSSGYYYYYDSAKRLIAVYDLNDTPIYFNIWGIELIGKASYNY